MAQQAYYQQQMAMAQKGPLQPGQIIKLSQHTVTVEKYLSQGGFAHVYLVRTATPVMGTTQHVLKRMAVADVATLAEVKKEVDIMRLLRGHPNIVHLLDSASRPLPNGQHEVYILMEFCQGGGIIDMMNRRLRERLTERDILQIFVDVCEAVACMHSLQPPLLHRDLKVENILQASDTSFKLCDFGSAAPSRPKPPSTMEEIKLLEADLNRSTTLQYRAPEMVDVYLRRPIDEKSDVWALGVLLYKLCYYTTPFEAHGPLAILHVQYSIPGYPVYSKEINALIGCMLRELGVQRPSVFEVLSVVHRMRGTKSPFNYPRPQQIQQIPPSPSLPPSQRPDQSPRPAQGQPQTQRERLRDQKDAYDAMGMRRGRPNEVQASPMTPRAHVVPMPGHGTASPMITHAQAPPISAHSAPPATSSQATSSPSKATSSPSKITSRTSPTKTDPQVKPPSSSSSSALPSRQPLAPLTRSRPSKSGRDSDKGSRAQKQSSEGPPRKSVATPVAPASPRKSAATPAKAPAGGVRVGPGPGSSLRPAGTGTNGVKGLNTGGAKGTAKSPTTDFFNDQAWKNAPEAQEKDIWGGETVGASASTTTNKFDGFADSFDGANGSTNGVKTVGGVALPGLHRPSSQLQHHASGTHHSSSTHHHPSITTHHHTPSSTPHQHQHQHQPAIQHPKTTRSATRDAFEGLGIPSAPSPALSLRELAARSPNPSPGVPNLGISVSPVLGMHGSSLSPMPLSTSNLSLSGQSPSPFSRSPHPLTTGATTGTGVTGTLTTQATAGSAASGSKGGTGAKANALALSAEERFPSIEELDAATNPGTWRQDNKDREVPKLPPRPRTQSKIRDEPAKSAPTRPGAVTQHSHMTGPNSLGLRPPVQATGSRSQQVTGTAMKDPERANGGTGNVNGNTTPKVSRALPVPPATMANTGSAAPSGLGLLRRPSNGGVKRVASINAKSREDSSPSPTPSRRTAVSPSKPPTSPTKPRPSSVIQTSTTKPALTPKPAVTPKPTTTSATPKPAAAGGRTQSQTTRPDWLTGDFLEAAAAMGISVPDSPSKRSSAILSGGSGSGGGGAGTRYQTALKSPTHPATDKLGRATPDRLGRSTPDRLSDRLKTASGRQTSMTESSNDEGPEDPIANFGRAKLERRGAVTRSSPERKSRSSTLDVTTATTTASTPHRRQPSENLIDLGPNHALSPARSGKPTRTPSTASNASHPPTSGPRSRRPQSMFIQPGSTTLSPPVDANAPTKRSVRRGSISDMVSRYEAMASPTVENHSTGSGGVQRRPSIAAKPAGLRVPSAKVAPERGRSPSPTAARPRSPDRLERDSPAPASGHTANTSVFNRENRTRTSPTDMMREVPIQDGNARAPSPAGRRSRSRPPSPLKISHPVMQPTPTQARTARVLHNITPPHSKDESSAKARAPSPPASPDKPYQGVGRLIDQWQKKAGAEPARPVGQRVGRR